MMFTALLPLLFAAGADCQAPSAHDATSCAARNGHCFDLSLDAQPVVPLQDGALRDRLDGAISRPVCWQVVSPVTRQLNAQATANARTDDGLGKLYDELEIVLTGLEGQQVPTRQGIRKDPTVMIGGVPMQTVVDVIDTDALPPGEYIATFRVRGPKGWDRKAVHLRVAD
jgi:hypothetical protein